MLDDARRKYLSYQANSTKEATERLWDAWERLKTIENPDNKKESISNTLDKVSREAEFRKLLEEEARTLTNVGNQFYIRHSEASQTELENEAQLRYLFHRLLSMILLVLNSGA